MFDGDFEVMVFSVHRDPLRVGNEAMTLPALVAASPIMVEQNKELSSIQF